MFRLGAFTDEISKDLEYACGVCEEFGVEGAELRGIWDVGVHQLSEGQVQDVKRILGDHNMVVCSLGSPFGKCELGDAREVAEHMDILRRCGDIGQELGCNLIRGFAFWGHELVGERPWDTRRRALEPVAGILEEKQAVLGLENEAACYVGTAAHTRHFLDMLGCDRIKAVWDPANHIQDANGDDMPAFPDGYELLKKDIVHVHVKDAMITQDGGRPNVFLGMGAAQWDRQFKALLDDAYDGFVSLETHVLPDRFPPEFESRYREFLVGDGRDGREASSRVFLAWIRDTVSQIA